MPDASNGPTSSSAVIAVVCVVLVGGLCIAGFAQWFFRHRRQSGSSTRDHPVLPISRFIQLQTSEVRKQPQSLLTEDDLNKCLPTTNFKTWKGQQLRARHCLTIKSSFVIWAVANNWKRENSAEPATQDVLTTVSTFSDISSTHAPISPGEDPVYVSPLKGAFAETRMSVPNEESPKQKSRLESYQLPAENKKYPAPAAQQKTAHWQSASDVMFSNYVCAICLSIIEDEAQVRGLPCAHAFHVECVDKWVLRRRSSCPVCKADLPTYVEKSMISLQ